jgi:hypothetical protein
MTCPVIKPCDCELAGYCERHGFTKTPHAHKLCQTRPDYRSKWDWQKAMQAEQPTEPGLAAKAAALTKAFVEWCAAGRPMRPGEQREYIYEKLCTPCEHFEKGKCKACGCGLKTKISWATTCCPLDNPKWVAEVAVQ